MSIPSCTSGPTRFGGLQPSLRACSTTTNATPIVPLTPRHHSCALRTTALDRNSPAFRSDQDRSAMTKPCRLYITSQPRAPSTTEYLFEVCPIPQHATCWVTTLFTQGSSLRTRFRYSPLLGRRHSATFHRADFPTRCRSTVSAVRHNPRAQPRVTRPTTALVNPPKRKPPLLGSEDLRLRQPDCPL